MSNIVGEDHLDYVKNQITARQEILGKTTRGPEDIVWQNNRNGWIRLISSVDIADEDVLKYDETNNIDRLVSNSGSEFRNEYLGLEGYGGNQLSKELILQGGALNYDQPKFGVANNNSNLPNSNFNYGFGGNEFGLKPMPGITSFSLKTYNKGSLRKAQLQITAHNRNQFQYLDSVYLRLGYTMLLEWGNTKFPIKENNGSIRYATQADISSLSLKDEFLDFSDNDLGSSYFYTRIEELREQSQGNYDGFLGQVVNFSWDFTKEGTYQITLDLISIGSVVESLKINTNIDSIKYPNPPNQSKNESNDPDVKRPSSLEVFIDVATTISFISINNPGLPFQDFFKDSFTEEESEALQIPQNFGEETRIEPSPYNGFDPKTINVPFGLTMTYDNFFNEEKVVRKHYLRLKTLLDFINTKLLLYDRNSKSSFITIDTSLDTFCYSNGYSFSGDPSKMVNQLEITIKDENISTQTLPSKCARFHDKLEDNTLVGRVMNLYFERDYLKNLIKDKTNEDGDLFLYDFLKSITNSINSLLGGVNKLNVRLVEKKVEGKEIFIPSSPIPIKGPPQIKEVLEIYDEVPFKKIDTNPVFNIYGFNPNESKTIETTDKDGNPAQNTITYNGGSFITDFSLQTKITKELSTQIAIGAQATGRAVGEDATVFSKWNIGLVDRIIPSKLDIDKAKQSSASSRVDFIELKKTYIEFLRNLKITEEEPDESNSKVKYYNILPINLISTSNETPSFIKFKTIQKQFFKKVLAYDAERKGITTPFIGFIPINLSLTMDGLSGIRIFDKLTVNSKFLPKNYTDTLNFIITSLDHKFEQNKWVTQVGTLSVPKLFDKTPEVVTKNILDEALETSKGEEIRGIRGSKDIPSYFVLNNRRLTKLNNRTGYLALDYQTESSKFRDFKPERVSDLETEVLQYYNPLVQNNFREFLKGLLKILPTGYEFRINSVVRSFGDQIRINLESEKQKDINPSLSSMHLWGTAIDIAIYEAGSIDNSNNLLYGKGKPSFEKWKELGIEQLAIKHGLRWGGTFTDYKFDNVHFDAKNIIESEGWTEEKARKALIETFIGLKPYITDSLRFDKNKKILGAKRRALDSFTLGGYTWSIDENGEVKINLDEIQFVSSLNFTEGKENNKLELTEIFQFDPIPIEEYLTNQN